MDHVLRDGVRLAYEDTGGGDRSAVFIHGWCGDHTHFGPQIEHLQPTHRCVTLDLRGHGESDQPQDGYSIENFAGDVAFLCGELGLRKPLVIGHSMGGTVALALAARYPELPSAIVMFDGAFLGGPGMTEFASQFAEQLKSDDYLTPLGGIFNGMFMATDDRARRDKIVAGALATPRHVVLAEWDALWGDFDAEAAAKACSVPAMYVGSYAPVADMTRVRAAMPNAIIAQTAGAGHYNHLEVPEQANAMIDRFLAINAAPAASK